LQPGTCNLELNILYWQGLFGEKPMSFSITILSFHKKGDLLDEEIERYQKLVRPYASIAVTCCKSPHGSSLPKAALLEAEADAVLAKIPKGACCIALSEEGKCQQGSRAFAEWLSRRAQGGREVVFIVGGAYGLSPRLKKSCAETMSLSPLTFPHKLALVVLLEQIYRAYTILKGHPYHK
jgi:23S rRNA (pseudouridine1915-N3)-methyltransferase